MTGGTLYGLGVGPGDPELITLKALRHLRAARAVAYPVQRRESLARAIVASYLRPDQDEIPIDTPMAGGDAAQAGYDAAAATIASYLARGENVVVLCEGDPLFYGSFMYLLGRLAGSWPVEVVPGVSSLTAGAAAVPVPLVGRNERLLVMPAGLPDDQLRQGLSGAETVVLVKVGRHLERVRTVVRSLGLEATAHYVERATQPGQRVLPLAAVAATEATYFALILIFKGQASWR